MTAKDSKNYDLDVLFPSSGDDCRILIGCRRDNYSASRIAHAIEDCDAHLINLNILGIDHPDAETVIDLRVNRRNAIDIARSLSRYGFDVLDIEDNDSENDPALKERIDQLIRFLEI